MRVGIMTTIGLLCLYLTSSPVSGAETDTIFDHEIATLKAKIKEIRRVMSVKDMTKEAAARLGVELSLLNGQLGNVTSAKTSTDISLRNQYANSLVTKYLGIYNYSITYRKDYETRRDLRDVEIEPLKAALAKVKGWQKELKRISVVP